MTYKVETITAEDGSEYEEIEVSMDCSFGVVRLKLPRRYNLLLNNMVAARKTGPRSGLQLLCQEQEAIITILIILQVKFESPSLEDFKKITIYPVGESEADCADRLKHITEMIVLTIKLMVGFASGVPGFDTLSQEDQGALLKASYLEVLLLRLSRKYDEVTNSVDFGTDVPYTREIFRDTGLGDFADYILKFCIALNSQQIDNITYALLTAMTIFPELSNLREQRKVRNLRDFYIKALRAYIYISQPQKNAYFDWLLLTLYNLREAGKSCSEQWLSMKVSNINLPHIIKDLSDNQ